MVDQRFGKDVRLRRRGEYLRVQRQGVKIHLPQLVAFALAAEGRARVGITVSSKVGNAVCRNRIKRLLREVWRRAQSDLPTGWDVVLIAKRGATEGTFEQLARQMRQLAQRLRGLRRETA